MTPIVLLTRSLNLDADFVIGQAEQVGGGNGNDFRRLFEQSSGSCEFGPVCKFKNSLSYSESKIMAFVLLRL